MAFTQLADAIIPERYADYTSENSPELTRFIEAGVIAQSPLFNQLATSGGELQNLPFWKDLDASVEPNYSDDTASTATPQKITSGNQIARVASINEGWSSADLVAEMAGSDPMQRVKDRTTSYWSKQFQRRTIHSLEGVKADNVANDSSDMVNDVSGATNADITADTVFSRAAFTGTAFTSGDHFDDYTAILVHSTVYKRMVDNDDIDYIPDSQGQLVIPTFMGRRVIVDDAGDILYTAAGGTGPTDTAPFYTSILFGSMAMGYAEGMAKMPVEIEREAAQGNGGGLETMWERKRWIIHPFGFKWIESSVAGQSPTWAELELAANWDRVVDRKNVPLAFLVTNG